MKVAKMLDTKLFYGKGNSWRDVVPNVLILNSRPLKTDFCSNTGFNKFKNRYKDNILIFSDKKI